MPTDEDLVRTEYARLARRYDRRWSLYIQRSVAQTVRRMGARTGERILDVGCGTGYLLRTLLDHVPGLILHGVELCPEMASVARERLPNDVVLQTGSADALPFPAASFDMVVSTSAFHYFPDPTTALAEMMRVLRPGGRVVITDWCYDYWTCQACDWFLRHMRRRHHRTYRSVECRDLLQAAGFADAKVEIYRITWFWGLMTANCTAPT